MPDNNMFVRAITTAEIVDEVWSEVARNRTDTVFSRDAIEQAALANRAKPKAPPLGMPLPLLELLGLDGVVFIDAAYATLLGRLPDAAGAAYMTAELDRGRDKIALLGALQRSDEARAGGRRIAGLRRRDLARRAYRVPVLGRLVSVAATALRRSGVSRRLAGRGDPMVALRAEFASRLAALTSDIDQGRRALEKQSAAQQRNIELLTRRLATLQAAQEAAAREAADERLRWVEHATKFGRNPAATEDGMVGALIALSEALRCHEEGHLGIKKSVTVAGGKAPADDALATVQEQVGHGRQENALIARKT